MRQVGRPLLQPGAHPHCDHYFKQGIFPSLLSPRSTINFIIIPAVNNLNEKEKLPELKKALATLFSKFGKILNIVAMSSFSRKGQAFIVYETVEQATAAMMQLQNFPFPSEEKRMRITYAKAKSDIVAKADGTFVPNAFSAECV